MLLFDKSLDELIQLFNIVWKPITPSNNGIFDQCQSEVSGISDSENWHLAGTYYHIDAMHAGSQLNRSERFTRIISDTDHNAFSVNSSYISHIPKFRS